MGLSRFRASHPNAFAPSRVLSCEVTLGELALPAIATDTEDGFKRLMEQHQQMVQRVAYRLLGRLEDAQDAAQEVFLRLFRNLDRVGADPKAWLYRVTVNVCNDHHRRRRVVVEMETRDPVPDPERLLSIEQRKRLLLAGLGTLPERERTAIVLRDIEGLSTAEVAAILGVEEVTVRSHTSSGRLKLAKYVRSRQ
jgi:RNA polymerase sigma-70 factor (ECF subfamily)